MLVVDDEPQVVWVLQFSLEAEGYTTFAANDGVEALAEIAEHHPKLMVLDIMMPTMDGWTVLEEMMKLPREERPRVVIVSALSTLRDRAKAAELGADAYVPKPFNVDDLLDVLHDLERSQSRQRDPRPSVRERAGASAGTTVVPTALQREHGLVEELRGALADVGPRRPPILWISNSHGGWCCRRARCDRVASIQSPAYSGARNSTDSYARNKPSSPS